MKTLSIIRHAKAASPDAYANDFDRPLTKRGHKDAQQISQLAATLEPRIDWVISSTAVRTRETTDWLSKILPATPTIQWEESAYLAEADQWLTLLRTAPPEAEHIAVIGHNPGVSDLVARLAGGALTYLTFHLPTAALATLNLEIFWWNQIRWGCGQLKLMVPPKPLRKLKES